ncbi:hypothetical protein RM572_21855 [Streptomyces sp. DSM 42041]|uniref:C2H2-type domain-containing protein n=1 Tax=Streptomyces hazeniae TaxID=3075538 RepID=A0ABU2NZL5_9ACTN|nr:hypothetical protein [Streptomyces sp. DSM 42041]MDT0381407.1 hypothetical protein [Streptomyces sp. DSM 42041]
MRMPAFLIHRKETPVSDTTATAWPKGVVARYLTVAGATVDVTGSGHRTRYRCTGCPEGIGAVWAESSAHKHAQSHAEKCRALPKPTA